MSTANVDTAAESVLTRNDPTAPTSQDHAEPVIVQIARQVRANRLPPDEFDTAFAQATVYAKRSNGERPGVMASVLPGRGIFVLAFSTLERLASIGDGTLWLSATGQDLLAQLPPGIGVLFDLGEQHTLPLLPQPDTPARFAGAVLPPTHHGPSWSEKRT